MSLLQLSFKKKSTQGFLYKTAYNVDHSCLIAVGPKDTVQMSAAQSGEGSSSPLLPQPAVSIVTMMLGRPLQGFENSDTKFTE